MKTSSAKAKGRRLQQWVRAHMLMLAPLHEDDVRSTSMGASGEDLLLSPRAREIFPLSIECKNQERLSIWQALEQACAHASAPEVTPALVFKRNHSETWACIPALDLLKLYSRLYCVEQMLEEEQMLAEKERDG